MGRGNERGALVYSVTMDRSPAENGAHAGEARQDGTILLGALLWAGFAVLVVALRGARWDENFEFARVLLGWVRYPVGHPIRQYVHGAYNLQTYAAAAQLWLVPSPALLNGFRNALFVWATVLPPFLLTSLVTRRALYGHVAAALFLAGAHLEFDSSYPLYVWPGYFSNGHVGIAFALVVVYFLGSGRWRPGYFLLGLVPCIHLGQWPPLLLLAGLHALWAVRSGRGRALLRALGWGALGLAICGCFWVVQRQFVEAPPTEGPYFSAAAARPIWEGRVEYHDIHRRIPVGNAHLVVGCLLLLGMAGVWVDSRSRGQDTAYRWLFVYGLCVASLVYGVMTVHFFMGRRVPYILLAWLPYRLLNHLPTVVMAMTLGLLLRFQRGRAATPWILAGALAFFLVAPVLDGVVPPGWFDRYLRGGEAVFFGLWGASLLTAAASRADPGRFRRYWPLAAVGGVIVLGTYHQFGAACVVAGAVVAGALGRVGQGRAAQRWGAGAAGLACAALVVLLFSREVAHRRHLPRSDFDRRLVACLELRGDGDAMLVGAPDQLFLQARTGHPVMVDMITPYHIGYMPSLGPSVQKIYDDLYGIRFDRPADVSQTAWLDRWGDRSRREWQALADAYGFGYVVAPPEPILDLDPLVLDSTAVLYGLGDDG